MENDIYKLLDQIMKDTHNIVTNIINQAKKEINREPISKLEENLLEKEFEALHTKYVNLRRLMKDYRKKSVEIMENEFGATITKKENEEECILVVRDIIRGYITASYTNMEYISDPEADIMSIYDGDEFETLRYSEYENYMDNINSIEVKDDLDGVKDFQFSLISISNIVDELGLIEAFERGNKKIDKFITAVDEKNPKLKFDSEKARERFRRRLIVNKYLTKYLMLNKKYNGVVTEDLPFYGTIKNAQRTGSIDLLFGISKDDFSKKKDRIIGEYLEALKILLKTEFNYKKEKSKKAEEEKDKKSKIQKIRDKVINWGR